MGLEIKRTNTIGLTTVLDTSSIDMTKVGPQISADVKISSNAADAGYKKVALDIQGTGVNGLRAQLANEDIQDAAAALLTDTNSIDLTYTDGSDTATADVRLSSDAADAGYALAAVDIRSGASKGLRVQTQMSGIDHGSISGLGDDDHGQYLAKDGRSGGQSATGGTAASDNLTLVSTAHATKGKIYLGLSAYDDATDRLAIADSSAATKLDVNGDMSLRSALNTDAGVLTGVPTTTSFVVLRNATGIKGVSNTADGKLCVLTNDTGAEITIYNEAAAASAAERILTGTADDISLADGASLFLIYDGNEPRWRVVGGAGGGGLSIKSNQTLSAAATITLAGNGRQLIRVQGNGGAITVDATTGVTAGTKDGIELRLQGLSDTNTVTIASAGNMRLNGTCVLGNGDVLDLMWNNSNSTWDEVGRSE